MKKLSALFFYYCLVISLFIFVSSFFNTKKIEDLPTMFLFLPIPAYFIYTLVKYSQLKKNAPKGVVPALGINLKEKETAIILSFFLLAALVMFAIKKIIG